MERIELSVREPRTRKVSWDEMWEEAKMRCRQVEKLREILGVEPPNAKLTIDMNEDEFGFGFDVIGKFDPTDPVAAEYIEKCGRRIVVLE